MRYVFRACVREEEAKEEEEEEEEEEREEEEFNHGVPLCSVIKLRNSVTEHNISNISCSSRAGGADSYHENKEKKKKSRPRGADS